MPVELFIPYSVGIAAALLFALKILHLSKWPWWHPTFATGDTEEIWHSTIYYPAGWYRWLCKSPKVSTDAGTVNADLAKLLKLYSVAATGDDAATIYDPKDKGKGVSRTDGEPACNPVRSRQLGSFQFTVMYAIHELGDEAYSARIGKFIEEQTGKLKYSQITGTLHRLVDQDLATFWMTEPIAKRGGRSRKVYTLKPSGVRALQQAMADHQALITPSLQKGTENDKDQLGSSVQTALASGGAA